MNKILFTVSVIVAAGLGYWLGKNNATQDVIAHSAAPSVQENVNAHVVVKNSQAEEKPLQVIVAAPAKEQPSLSPESSVADESTQNQIDAIKAEYEFKQRSEAFTNWLTKNQAEKPWFDLGVEMRGRFEDEDVDHSWAGAEEGHIQSLFSQEQALAGIALKSTSCKSTQCRITVSVMDQEHANEMAMTISQILGSEKATQIIIDNQPQQGETTFYVARNEKGFEFN